MSTENMKSSIKTKQPSGEGSKATFTPVTIKKEPISLNGSDPTLRLSSFSLPRDLTLGGAGRGARGGGSSKKLFTPNLNVTRNKNAAVKTSKDTSARGRNRPDRGKSDRGRGRGGGGRGGSNLIQTSGVFSEGAGSVNIRKHMSSGSYSRSENDTPSALVRPTLVKREGGMKIDLKAEEEEIRELLGDDDDDMEDNKADPDWIPIKLNDAKWKELKVEKKEEPLDAEIKVEPSEDKAEKGEVTTQKAPQPLYVNRTHMLSNTPRYPTSIDDLLNSTQPQIFMMQLPDALPCEDPDDTPDKPPSGSKDQPQEPENVEKKNPLKDLVEGQIGKLIRYKSGKLKLILGESHFDVTMGIETGFLQDVMSITTNREERSGNMINLGPIQAKLTATPDWEYLLRQK